MHEPDLEQARCCPLGTIQVDLVKKALARNDSKGAVHAHEWALHFVDAHQDHPLNPLPGCPDCMELAAPAGPGGRTPAALLEREKRIHYAWHLVLPQELVSFETPA